MEISEGPEEQYGRCSTENADAGSDYPTLRETFDSSIS